MLSPKHLNYCRLGDEHGIQKDHPQPGFRRPRHGHLPGTKPQHQAHGAINNTINWVRVESILLSHYTVGTSEEGAHAYPPLMLFKCLLLQKWFRIPSDPELENQITDRLSFNTFLGLSFSQPAPDHSTFSRFRSRRPKQAMDAINSEILRQFEQ
jgi:hypothetical protein